MRVTVLILCLSSLLLAQEAGPSPIAGPLAEARAAMQAIADLPDEQRTFANTVGAIDALVAVFFADARMTAFMESVSPDPDERARGTRAAQEMGTLFIELEQHEGLYRALLAYQARAPEELGPEQQRLLDVYLRDFRRAGLDLPAEARARILEIETALNELTVEFRKNIREDSRELLLTEDELAGLSPDFLASLPRIGELVQCALQGPIVSQVFSRCAVGSTRHKFGVAYSRRALANLEVLDQLIALRHEKANLLGYETFAAYQVETRMAQSPARVHAFYEELRPKLRAKAEQDFALLQAAKREALGDPEAELKSWDVTYYLDRVKQDRYAVDTEKVREYFPLARVTEGLFAITQQIYGLVYEDVTDQAEARGLPLWHPDVRLYEVSDKASGEVLGGFYIDLHPRPNKYSHAAQFPLVLRRQAPDGPRYKPLVALVCNFSKPTATKPALLSHGEVETYFHEFGHCLHSILSEAQYAQFAGTQVARDFVEAPSQMFENWVWDREVLARFAGHYETGAPFPDALLDGMRAARHLGSGLRTEGQVFLGMLDLAYHGDPDGAVDTDAVRAEIYAQTRLFPPQTGTHFQASFGHLTGYAAGYYGYLWSLVFAQDMYTRFADAPLDPAIGLEYREKVLSRGGTVDELAMVRDFLGRAPSSDAFLEHLGLETD